MDDGGDSLPKLAKTVGKIVNAVGVDDYDPRLIAQLTVFLQSAIVRFVFCFCY